MNDRNKKNPGEKLPPIQTPPDPSVPNRAHTEMSTPSGKPYTFPPKSMPGEHAPEYAPEYPPEFPAGGIQVFPLEMPARGDT